MIPKNLTQEDILKAIAEVVEAGVPKSRQSTEWSVLHKGKHYPPKYIISIANKVANGEEWSPSKFSGGTEANQFLESLGFEIVSKGTQDSEDHVISYSWEVLSENTAIKKLDKSAFLHHGTGIPNEIRSFFGLESFVEGENRPATLLYKGKSFEAHFYVDPTKRLRLFWKADFSDVLKNELPDWFDRFSKDEKISGDLPVMRFNALASEGSYEIILIESRESPSDNMEEKQGRSDWSERECYFAVWAYDQLDADREIVKKHLFEEISTIVSRSAKSIEFKIQNVSSFDPRPRANKPISEAPNAQKLLGNVFKWYWEDR